MAVNLQKGQKISLEKEAGGTLTSVVMGLGWDVAKKKGLFGLAVSSLSTLTLPASSSMTTTTPLISSISASWPAATVASSTAATTAPARATATTNKSRSI